MDFGTGDALSTKVTTDTIPDLHPRGPTILPHNKNAPPGRVPTGPRASVAWYVQSWKSSAHVQTPVSYQLKIKAPRSTAGQAPTQAAETGFTYLTIEAGPNVWSEHSELTVMNSSDALLRSELLPFNTCHSTALTEASWTGGGAPAQEAFVALLRPWHPVKEAQRGILPRIYGPCGNLKTLQAIKVSVLKDRTWDWGRGRCYPWYSSRERQ